MKILHIINSLDPRNGGTVEAVRQLATGFSQLGYSQCVATNAGEYGIDAGENVEVVSCGRSSGPGSDLRATLLVRYGFNFRFLLWLFRNVRRFDIVIVHGLWNFSTLASSMTVPFLAKRYYVFPHGMLDRWFATISSKKNFAKQVSWILSEGRLINGCRRVFFTTRDEQIASNRVFWPYRPNVSVVGLGIKAKPAPLYVDSHVGSRLLLFVGRIHPKKGCDLLVEAFCKVASDYQDVELAFMGPDEMGLAEGLMVLAKEAGVEDRVKFLGLIEGDEKWSWYQRCSALALPSHQENFGLVVAEALSISKPVLISDKVNIHHEVSGEGAGIVSPDTVEGTEAGLRQFLNMSRDDIAAMSSRAMICFQRHFDIQTVVERLDSIFKEDNR